MCALRAVSAHCRGRRFERMLSRWTLPTVANRFALTKTLSTSTPTELHAGLVELQTILKAPPR